MEWVETTGRSVEEAKEAALDQLGVDEQDAEFEIVEEPRFGLFGRLRSEARVRARVRPTKPRPKEDRRDRRGRRRTGSSPASEEHDGAVPPAAVEAKGPARPVPAGSGKGRDPSAASGDRSANAGGAAGRTRRGSRRGGGSRPARPTAPGEAGGELIDDFAVRAASDGADRENEPESTDPGGGMDVSLEDQAAVALDFLEGLVGRMSVPAAIETTVPEDDTVELNLQGNDLGLLIGPKGATLLAIQDLTRTVVQRKTSANNGRILVDVAGYRRKRKDALAKFSRQVAAEVQTTGSRRVLEPMSAADRKVVHDTVNQIEGVTTVSEGEDPRRRVVIVPAPAST